MSNEVQQQNLKNLEKRSHYIERNLRCLDCSEITYSIEHVDSPIATEQKKMVKFLLRKGYSDLDIYKEIGNVYGRNTILKVQLNDDNEENARLENTFIIRGLQLGFGGMSALFFLKYGKKFLKK